MRCLAAALVLIGTAVPAFADDHLPPFDFSDEFYLANGINPVGLVGRPTGQPPGSIIDNRENGPNFNNVRILQQNAAYDGSGHPIFFSVTGLLSLSSFTNNAAGQQALEIADAFKVYEFPRAANPTFSVFPKRQDLVADTSGGYFSNDPLGIWQINLVRYTPAAFQTSEGRQALADLAARNGRDLDGTPVIRTVSDVRNLESRGFVNIVIPAADGSHGLRWFLCPVIEDPRNGAIAPDAFLVVTNIPGGASQEFVQLFHCLQTTGNDCETRICLANCDNSTTAPVLNVNDFTCFLNQFAAGAAYGNCDNSSTPPILNVSDFICFMNKYAAGCP